MEFFGNRVNCIMMYDKISQRILDAGYDEENDKISVVHIEQDERIVGVRSKVLEGKPAAHLDL